MKIRTFKTAAQAEERVFDLLSSRMKMVAAKPHGILLPGGTTPRGVYHRLALEPPTVNLHLHLMLSDERHVPPEAPESNYGGMKPMLDALAIGDSRALRVHTELELEAAANRYEKDLRAFFRHGGRITLALLGLGMDGHTAGLFSGTDIFRGLGRLAMPVRRPDGLEGVTVTRDLLQKAEHIVFFAVGPEKTRAVRSMEREPGSVPAGMAVEDISNVEVWFAP